MSIQKFFKIVGFKENDYIVKSSKYADGKGWCPIPQKVLDYCAYIERGNLPELNLYYSHATHSGATTDRGIAFTKENSFDEIVCLVIDIDYGPHHKDAPFQTLEEAIDASKILPPPTVVIHSGGGLQLVYRFRNRIRGDAGKLKYKEVYKSLSLQVYSDSCQGIGHAFRLPFSTNYKTGVPSRAVEILDIFPKNDYTLEELEAWCKSHRFTITPAGECKRKQIATKKAKKKKVTKRKKKSSGKDNSREAFLFIDNLLRSNPGIKERSLLALMKRQFFYEHYSAFGENAEKYCRQDIRRIRRKLTKEKRPQPFTKVKKLKYSGEPSSTKVEAMRESFNSVYDTSGNEKITICLSLMEQLYLKQIKGILNFPCASGKTTAAMILASAHASPDNRFWIVTYKIEDVKRIAESLQQTGCNAREWHGRTPECPIERLEFISEPRGFFCRKCANPCSAQQKYLAQDVWDAPDADVLVTTHSHWAAAVTQEKIPNSVKCVIVDESPTLMEYFSLDKATIMNFRKVLFPSFLLHECFKTDISFLQTMLSDGSCKKTPALNTLANAESIKKHLYLLLSKGGILPEIFEKMLIFLDFFSSSEIYGFKDGPNNNSTMTFIRGTVNLHTSIPHLILDGSALMSDVHWEGFHIFNCPELKQKYPQTTIQVINGNPTKAFLAHPKKFEQLTEAVLETVKPKNTLLLFRNKELRNDIELASNIENLRTRLLEKVDVKLLELNRGEHIGSNKGRTAQVNAICMSLFNTLSYYVLRTALVHHRDISTKEIWRIPFQIPAMKRNGGFVSEEIQETYCRAISLDLYQTILRGCIRDNPANNYNVICAVSGLDILFVLQEELPGATFQYENEKVVNALIAGEADSQIIKLMSSQLSERSRYERLTVIRRSLGV